MQSTNEDSRDKLGIVVVAYNASDVLERNIGTLTLPSDTTVFLVDNSTERRHRDAIRELSERRGWRYLAVDGNPGFGAGVNIGARAALAEQCEALLLLNPDATIDTASIARLRDEGGGSRIVAPRILRSDGKVWFANGTLDLVKGIAFHSNEGPTDWITGACMYIPSAVWRALGGMVDDYFLYWEDVEFSHRFRAAGGELVVVSAATAIHEVGATQAAEAGHKSDGYFFFNSRNRIRFAFTRLGLVRALGWLVMSPFYWRRLARRGRPEFRGRVRCWALMVRGTAAGIRDGVAGRGSVLG